MRKVTLFLLGLLAATGAATAQTLLPSTAWQISGGSQYWFPASGGVVRGGAINPATGHLLVVSRQGGTNVVVVDAATGDSTAALDMTGVAASDGFFKLSEIGTTSDGQIFAAGLSLNNTKNIQLFRWASESATAEIVYNGPIGAGRWGDAFGVGGSGTAVELYLSGSGNDQIAVFDYDGTAATLRPTYLIPEAGTPRGRYGLVKAPGEDSLWINQPGTAIAKISLTTGEIGREIPETTVPVGFGDLTYFERMGRRYLGTGVRFGGTPSEYFAVVDVTTPGMEKIVFVTPTLGANPNGNAAGFVAYDATRDRLVAGATDNGIAAFDLSGFMAFEAVLNGFNETNPVASPATGTINVALAGDTITVNGRFDGLSAAFAGSHIHVGAVGANGPVAIAFTPTLSQSDTRGTFRTTIDLGDAPPNGISATDFMAALMDGGLYFNVHSANHPAGEIRGQLLPVGNAAPTAPAITAPAEGATVLVAGDFRADVEVAWTASTDADGDAVTYVWQLGTAANFSGATTRVLKRSSTPGVVVGTVGDLYRMLTMDFGLAAGDSVALYHRALASDGSLVAAGAPAQVYFKLGRLAVTDATWRVETSATGFFRADNNTRGGAYNPTTGHVIAVSRSGGLKMVMIDAATGDSVGVLSTAGVAGGTFVLSEIGVTADGQIFGANLSVAPATSAVKVYRWADEFSAPTLVFESTGLEGPRYGDSFGLMGAGDAVTLFLTGSGNERIAVLKPTAAGDAFELDDYLVPEAGEPRARGGIAASMTPDSIWVKSPTHALAKVALAGGGRRDLPTSLVSTGYSDLASATVEVEGVMHSYLLTGVKFQGAENFALVDVTTPGAEFVVGLTDTLGVAPNGNASGFAAFDKRNGRLIVASTNNAIAAFDAPVMLVDAAIAANALPTPAAITAPADGAMLTLEGGAGTAFTATWSPATDDGGSLTYRWQLSTSADFSGGIVVDADAGADNQYTTTFGAVDALLMAAGVADGGTATVYHRVVATDGTNYAASAIASVVLTRGLLVGVDDPATPLPAAFRLHGNSPNPLASTTTLRFDLPAQADVTVRVYDTMGREVMKRTAALAAGADRTLALDGAALAAGVYVYRLEATLGGRAEVRTGRFAVVR